MSRTKNAVNNTIWGIVSKLSTLIMPFLVRAVMIQRLGVEYLGLNSLFTSIISVLNLAELGIGSAIVYSMYKPIAENDTTVVSALLRLYRFIYRIIGLVVLVVGILLMPFLPNLINGSVPSELNIYVLFGIYLFDILISYCLFGYRSSLLYACQRNDVVSKATVLFHSIMYIAQIIVLLLTRNYYLYVLFLPVSTILINISCAIYSRYKFPEYKCRGEVSSEQKKDIKKRVLGLSLNKVAYASRNAFDSIILSSFIGLAIVGVYNNYYYIISSAAAVLKIIMTSITASIGNSIAIESIEKNEQDLNTISFQYTFIACFCSCCLISIFQPFMRLWAGENLLFSDVLMVLVVFYFLIDKMENVIGVYYDAAGMWWNGKFKGLLEALVNLSLDILLGFFFGVVGVIIATIISILFVSIPLSTKYMYRFYFKKSFKTYLSKQYLYLAICCVISLMCYFLTKNIPYGDSIYHSILFIAVRLFISVLSSIVLFWLCFHGTDSYKNSIEWLKPRLRILLRHKKQ